VIGVLEDRGVANKVIASSQQQVEGSDGFSKEYKRLRAQVDLGTRHVESMEKAAEGPSSSFPEACKSGPSKKLHTSFKWRNLSGCPMEALNSVIPKDFGKSAGHICAKSYAKILGEKAL
jgi:hypothetical protein